MGWALFAALNLGAMLFLAGGDGGTIPFHFIWVSLTIVYGFTVWAVRPTIVVLGLVMVATSAAILLEIAQGPTRADELTEVPLMAAMFVAMVWHARRREAAEKRAVGSREREREFIRDASHHLKTPLALARGYAELVRRRSSEPAADGDAGKLIDELDRLTRIVDNLLLLMDSDGKSAIEHRDVDLRELAVELADRWEHTVDRRFVVRAEERIWASGDRERLESALNALLENAVEATEAGSRIWIAVSKVEGRARIRVVDPGRGLSESAAVHMFERFWSERRGNRRRGSGLGLAIAKSIVEAHDGTIAGVRVNGMTVFTIELPAVGASGLAVESQVSADPRGTRRLTVAS